MSSSGCSRTWRVGVAGIYQWIPDRGKGSLQAAIEGRIGYDMGLFPPASVTRRGELLISLPLETAAKAALYVAMKEAGVSKSELARRLHVDEKEVRRMLDMAHATKFPRLDMAVRALGRRLEISLA